MEMQPTFPMAAMSGSSGGFGGDNGLLMGLLFGGALTGGGGLFGNRNGAAVAGADLATTALSQQVQTLQGQVSNNTVMGEINELEGDVSSGLLATMSGIKDNANLYLSGTGNILTGLANGNFQTLNSINGAVGTITTQNYNQALTALNSANALNTTVLQSFNESSRDNANSFNSIQMSLQAQNMEAARCCCTLTNAIHSEAEATRALITSNRILDLTAQLNDVKSENSNLLQTNALIANNALQTSIMLQHLRPFPHAV